MSDESGDALPATDPQRPATDPWGNPLPPGTEQQPPRSAIPRYVPPAPPQPGPTPPPPPTEGVAPGTPPGETGTPAEPPESWWPADPNQEPPPAGTDAWGQPVGGPVAQTPPHQAPPFQPPYPGQPGYPGQPNGYGSPRNAGNAIGSMVCGIFSLLSAGYLGVVLGPVAIAVGLTAKRRIAASNGQLTGSGFATAGIVLGTIGLVVSIASILFLLANPDFIPDLMDKLTTTTTTPG